MEKGHWSHLAFWNTIPAYSSAPLQGPLCPSAGLRPSTRPGGLRGIQGYCFQFTGVPLSSKAAPQPWDAAPAKTRISERGL